MKERTDRITALLEKSLRGELTLEEKRELDLWLSEGIENKELYQQLTDQGQLLEKLRIHDRADSEAIWQKTMDRINPGAKVVQFPKKGLAAVIGMTAIKYAVAVVVLAAISLVVYFQVQKPAEPVAHTEKQEKATQPDQIVPGGLYAKLTLADGSTIELDKASDGDLSNQSGLNLSKTNGHLTYSGRFITSGPVSTGAEKHASLHNMVSTPRGGQYQITLPDGSRVWLNAASSLRFPLAFAGNQRIVEVTGEAYFEVQKMLLPGGEERMPFVVRTIKGGVPHEVEVLGTHFNVMAYEDEKEIRTSLIEGSVSVKQGTVGKKIKPGQQAIAQDGEISIINTDVEKAIGWRAKNKFIYAGGSPRSVLNRIGRWYNVEIVVIGKLPEEKSPDEDFYNLDIPMTMTFSDVMIVLEESFNIKTELEDRKLIINP
jgi:transmembrane sensor